MVDIDVVDHEQYFRETLDLANLALREKDYREWRWRHFENPFVRSGRADLVAAFDGTRLVGANCFIPVKFRLDGGIIDALLSCDTMVHPNNRGKGVFLKMIGYAERYYRQKGITFLLGFPNDKSLPGFVRAGWKKVMNLHPFNALIDQKSFFENRFSARPFSSGFRSLYSIYHSVAYRPPRLRDISLEISDQVPEDISLVATLYEKGRLELERRKEYLHWRIDRSPKGTYRHYSARRQGSLVGYGISADYGLTVDGKVDKGLILDLVFRRGEEQVGSMVIQSCMENLAATCNRVAIQGSFDSKFRGLLRRNLAFHSSTTLLANGSRRKDGERGYSILMVKQLNAGPGDMTDPSIWNPTFIYDDAV